MRKIIKKILKESEDDFGWAEDIISDSDNIEGLALVRLVKKYLDGSNFQITMDNERLSGDKFVYIVDRKEERTHYLLCKLSDFNVNFIKKELDIVMWRLKFLNHSISLGKFKELYQLLTPLFYSHLNESEDNEYEWVEDILYNYDDLTSKARTLIPSKNENVSFIIVFERGYKEQDIDKILTVLHEKGYRFHGGNDSADIRKERIEVMSKYSKRPNGYINLCREYMTYGSGISTFNFVNDNIKWSEVKKIVL